MRGQTGSSGVEARFRSLFLQQCGEDDGGNVLSERNLHSTETLGGSRLPDFVDFVDFVDFFGSTRPTQRTTSPSNGDDDWPTVSECVCVCVCVCV